MNSLTLRRKAKCIQSQSYLNAGYWITKTTSLVLESKVQSVCSIPSTVTVMLLSVAVCSNTKRDCEYWDGEEKGTSVVQSAILRNVPPVICVDSRYQSQTGRSHHTHWDSHLRRRANDQIGVTFGCIDSIDVRLPLRSADAWVGDCSHSSESMMTCNCAGLRKPSLHSVGLFLNGS